MNNIKKYLNGILIETDNYGYGILDTNYILHFINEYQFFEIYINHNWEFANAIFLPYEGWNILFDNGEVYTNITGLPIRMELDLTNTIDTDLDFLM